MKRSQLGFIALVASHKVVIMESVVAVAFNAQAVAQQTVLVAVVGLGFHAAQIEIHLLVVEQVVEGGDHVISSLNRNQTDTAAGPLILNQAAVEAYKIRVRVAALVRACTPAVQVYRPDAAKDSHGFFGGIGPHQLHSAPRFIKPVRSIDLVTSVSRQGIQVMLTTAAQGIQVYPVTGGFPSQVGEEAGKLCVVAGLFGIYSAYNELIPLGHIVTEVLQARGRN